MHEETERDNRTPYTRCDMERDAYASEIRGITFTAFLSLPLVTDLINRNRWARTLLFEVRMTLDLVGGE